MTLKFLPSERLQDLLEELSRNRKLIVPARSEAMILFQDFGEDVHLDLANLSRLSAKEAAFPQTETLLSFGYEKETESSEPNKVALRCEVKEKETIAFGLRPCDARAHLLLDKVYLDDRYPDPYYGARRKNITLISLTCTHPQKTCFCTSVGGSPSDREGSDILLTEIEGGFLAEGVTEKGENILALDLFQNSTKEKEEQAEAVKKRAAESLTLALDLNGIEKRLMDNFENELWSELSAPCLNCGICTYVCPTCYCFNITDEQRGLCGQRIRTWDSCMYPLFTLETSGHNPRSLKLQRFRQRFNHKFSYYPSLYGEFLCVGCGRCILSCPVGIDIREVLKEHLER
ncbi:hypothetical protein HKBW3S42_00146 [Candidatus Hakubella thermalkaliphila]|uniref:4Fe-4S ferredoxin-type domain-containing protein n=1 Tax=Candidatus Hakubella thermalkaliphila TaxID=2754717 RepID=A0A6V8PIA4_9ACTN|nr:hypothetical protein HKBW3S42_00146 [Candidatus Hakubella thermalkaliphila]